MKPSSIVMTVIGPDRPGLVEELSAVISGHGGNWLESRMAQLAGQFAGILRVEAPADSAPALTQALLGIDGLTITLAGADTTAAADDPTATRLDVVGQDRPGIVREIARAVAARGVNVEELHTACESAPMSAEPLFRARARLRVPAEVRFEDLRADLESLSSDLMVDIAPIKTP